MSTANDTSDKCKKWWEYARMNTACLVIGIEKYKTHCVHVTTTCSCGDGAMKAFTPELLSAGLSIYLHAHFKKVDPI